MMETSISVAFLLLLLAFDASGDSFQLTILHTNDCHARFEQMNKYGGSCSEKDAAAEKCYGGVARRMTKLRELRSKEKNVLLLDAGDQFQGTFWFYFLKGHAALKFMHELGYDAMAIGNHEFDLGVHHLGEFIKNATFPILSCNIDASDEPTFAPFIQKSVVLERSGQKIGVIGYTTRDTSNTSTYSGKLKFLDEAVEIQKEADKLTKQGINKIIGLGHSGYEEDLKIAKKVRGVDIFVGGHSNSFLFSGSKPPGSNEEVVGKYPTVIEQDNGEKVLIVHDYAFGKYLGRLHVWFNEAGKLRSWVGNPILLDKATKQDPVILRQVNEIKEQMDQRAFEPIGRTAVYLDGAREKCRISECNLGNLLTDAMVYRHLAHPDSAHWANAAVGIWNGGAIRASIAKGPISLVDVITATPLQDTIELITINGSTLWKILEHSVSGLEGQAGRFLQVSGLIVTYNIKKPVGQRLVSVQVRCGECAVPKFEPLEKAKAYKIILALFLVNGGDAYNMIKPNLLERHTFGDLDTDLIVEYVKKMSPIFQGEEDRIRFIEEDDKTLPNVPSANAGSRLDYTYLCAFFVILGYFDSSELVAFN